MIGSLIQKIYRKIEIMIMLPAIILIVICGSLYKWRDSKVFLLSVFSYITVHCLMHGIKELKNKSKSGGSLYIAASIITAAMLGVVIIK